MMMIQVLPRPVEEIETTWDGVTRKRAQQWCCLVVDGLPTAFQYTTDPGKSLPPGDYELDPKSFNVQNGRLTMQRVVLKPLAPKAPNATPKA